MGYEFKRLETFSSPELIASIQSINTVINTIESIKLHLKDISKKKDNIEINQTSLDTFIDLLEQQLGFDVFLSTIYKSAPTKPRFVEVVEALKIDTLIYFNFHIQEYLNIYSKDKEEKYLDAGSAFSGPQINPQDSCIQANVEFDFEVDSILKVMQNPELSGPRSPEIYQLYTKMLLINTLNSNKRFKSNNKNIKIENVKLDGQRSLMGDKDFLCLEELFMSYYLKAREYVESNLTTPKVTNGLYWGVLFNSLTALKVQIVSMQKDYLRLLKHYRLPSGERFFYEIKDFLEDSNFLEVGIKDVDKFKFPTVREMQTKSLGASYAKRINDGIKKDNKYIKGMSEFKKEFKKFLKNLSIDKPPINASQEKASTLKFDANSLS